MRTREGLRDVTHNSPVTSPGNLASRHKVSARTASADTETQPKPSGIKSVGIIGFSLKRGVVSLGTVELITRTRGEELGEALFGQASDLEGWRTREAARAQSSNQTTKAGEDPLVQMRLLIAIALLALHQGGAFLFGPVPSPSRMTTSTWRTERAAESGACGVNT